MINGLEVNQYDNPKASKEKEMKISMDQLVEYGAENSDDKAITDLVQKTKNDIDYFSGNKKDEKAGFDINPIDSKGIIEIKDIKIDRNDNSFESFKETELNTRNIISQISENIITGKTDEGSFLQMKLKPENLGELTIKITESELGLAANIIAEKEDVKNILNKNSEELLALLSEKNIKINSITVESKDSFDFGNSTQDSGFSNQSFSEKREQNNYSRSNMIGEKQIEDGGSEAKNASRKNHEENTLNIYV
jgi:flagellar hook-length control protein FliK